MKILIIRLSAIGDVFFCTSLLRGLKQLYPGCQVTWLTEPMGASILEGHPLLDRLLVLPRREWQGAFRKLHWGQLAGSLHRFLKALRKESFDLVIDPQGLWKSAVWGRLARADHRIGLNGRDGSAFLYNEIIRVPRSERPFILSEYRVLVERLGGDPTEVAMQLHYRNEDRQAAELFLELNGIDNPTIFCPFTTRPQKHWFAESWAELGDRLLGIGYGPIIILGGPDDGPAALQIQEKMQGPCLLSTGERRPIGFALALIARARGLVGVDTGLTHAGIALNRPTIALFGSTRPYLETDQPRARVLYHPLDCSPCGRHPTCASRFDCMRLHTPPDVAAALIQLFHQNAEMDA